MNNRIYCTQANAPLDFESCRAQVDAKNKVNQIAREYLPQFAEALKGWNVGVKAQKANGELLKSLKDTLPILPVGSFYHTSSYNLSAVVRISMPCPGKQSVFYTETGIYLLEFSKESTISKVCKPKIEEFKDYDAKAIWRACIEARAAAENFNNMAEAVPYFLKG